MAKRKATPDDAACAAYRLALDWYAKGNQDSGERARLLIDLDAGKKLAREHLDMGQQLAEARKDIARLRERVTALEMDGSPSELVALRQSATEWKRLYMRACWWLKDIHGVTCWVTAAERYRTDLRRLSDLRRQVAAEPQERFSFLPGLAEQASPRLLEMLRGNLVEEQP